MNNTPDIIKEEVLKFLNESYSMEHENFKFSHQVKNVSVWNYSSFSNDMDVEVIQTNVILNWHIAFWLNQFGVENFIVTIDSVTGNYELELLDKLTGEVQQTLNKNVEEIKWNYVIEDAQMTPSGTLYVENIEFDFKSNTCTVNFYRPEN